MKKGLIGQLILLPAKALLRIFDFLVGTFTADKPVLNEDEFPFGEFLRQNRQIFLEEYNRFIEARRLHNVKDIYKVDAELNQDENWKAAPLVVYGYLFEKNSLRCPETIKILKQLPGCCAVMFLVAGPGKHVPLHKGFHKGIYRCLLTLKVAPNADCWISIDGRKIYFKEGESIVFDETVEHEVLNASTEPRVVLFLDIYRKLPFPLNLMNDGLFYLIKNSPFVKNILKDYQELEDESFVPFQAAEATLS